MLFCLRTAGICCALGHAIRAHNCAGHFGRCTAAITKRYAELPLLRIITALAVPSIALLTFGAVLPDLFALWRDLISTTADQEK